MIIKNWYILAGGESSRWEGYQGVKNKCHVKVDGEPILDRTIRLLEQNGASNYKIIGEGEYNSKREAFEGIAREVQAPFGILLGDCYYTEEIIKDAVNRDVDTWKHYYNCLPNKWTGCPWEEGYIHLVPNWEWWLEKMAEFNKKCDSGEIDFVKDFQIDRYLRGYPTDEYRAKTLDEHDIFWNDRTDDFDFPKDYDNFIKTKGDTHDYLTVILPFWNAGKFAYRMMKQLSEQLQFYPETELIAIDDGSTDGSSGLSSDGWTIIHQPNKGVASARNTGLMAATGDYITFVDADDEIEGDYLRKVYREMRSNLNDIVAFQWNYADGRPGPIHSDTLPHWAVWGYAFTRQAIGNEKFDENLVAGEDIEWLKRVLAGGKRMRISNDAIYKYDWGANPDSLTKRIQRGEIKARKGEE